MHQTICKPHTLQITNQGNCILYATTLNIPLGFPTPIEIAHGQWKNEFDVNHSILVLLSPSWEDEREKHIDQNTQFSDPQNYPTNIDSQTEPCLWTVRREKQGNVSVTNSCSRDRAEEVVHLIPIIYTQNKQVHALPVEIHDYFMLKHFQSLSLNCISIQNA